MHGSLFPSIYTCKTSVLSPCYRSSCTSDNLALTFGSQPTSLVHPPTRLVPKDMESACVLEQKKVIHELTQGIQMAKELRANLNSAEAREFLIRKILSLYDKALCILKSGHSAGQSWASEPPTSSLPDSSISTESPQSVGFEFEQPFIDRQGLNGVSKKRKASTWEGHVRVRNDNGLEGDTYDGYSWRKYGQKDILGAKFPR